VIESGRHAELLDRNGAYARLYELQFRDEDGSRRGAEVQSVG
jgi:hypothetical protein